MTRVKTAKVPTLVHIICVYTILYLPSLKCLRKNLKKKKKTLAHIIRLYITNTYTRTPFMYTATRSQPTTIIATY